MEMMKGQPMKASIFAYPQDLIDHGVERALDRIAALGFDQVSVPVNYHTAKLILPDNPKRKVWFTEPGATYFAPDLSKYDGPMKPYESSLTKGTDFYGELITTAKAAGLGINAWTVGLHNTPHGFQFPELCIETAFGDRLVHAFCPSNPGARAYLYNMAADLDSRFDLNAFEPETATFRPFLHGYHHMITGVEITPSLDYLLSLCFCPHCILSAAESGIDMAALRVTVKELIEGAFNGLPLPESPYNLPDAVEQLGELIAWRETVIEDIAADLKNDVLENTPLAFLASVSMPNSKAGFLYGADPAGLAESADYVGICGYAPEAEDLGADLGELSATGAPMDKLRVAVRPQWPDCSGEDNFAAKIEVLADAGVAAVGIYNYGTMRREAFDWIRKALASADAL